MNVLHFAYNLIGTAAGLALIPPLWLHQRRNKEDQERLMQRLGYYPADLQGRFQRRPLIWLHAVSVGEVGVAAAIVEALAELWPGCRIALSTATKQGLARARAHFEANAACFYAPLDLLGPSGRALKMVRPDVLALLETEIWPNLIIGARRMGVRTAVLNGRISVRTIHRYLRVRPLMRHTLSHIDVFSMISDADAQRIESLGADARRILVNGNAKFDGPDPLGDGGRAKAWAKALYNLAPDMPVIVAGSTRDPEEPVVLQAFQKLLRDFPKAVLILAPRHTQRVPQIEEWLRDRRLTWQRRSALGPTAMRRRTAQVVLLDTIGELSNTYSVADLVFCGGSLVPKGGQNLLEPAAWAKPVMYGPSMEDFADARTLIENAGGGRTVANAEQIAGLACEWLRSPQKAAQAGRAARQAILSHRGAARKHAGVILRLLHASGRAGPAPTRDFSTSPAR